MLNSVNPELEKYPSFFSNWLDLMMNFTNPYYEIAIVGQVALIKVKEFNKYYIPNKLIAGSLKENQLPLFENSTTLLKHLFISVLMKPVNCP